MTTAIEPAVDLSERDVRQRQLLPPQRLAACQTLVIGVGAIGRQVALQLAAVGVHALTLVDDDVVGVENLAAQGYWPANLGQAKVQATAQLCRCIHPPAVVTAVQERFGRSSPKRLGLIDAKHPIACFACVDSITTRRLLWEALKDHVAFWADGRMAAETIRVLASDRPATDSYYATTLFDAAEAHGGSCTARSTIYAASIAAGLMLSQFSRYLRQMAVEPDQTLNLLAAELTVA